MERFDFEEEQKVELVEMYEKDFIERLNNAIELDGLKACREACLCLGTAIDLKDKCLKKCTDKGVRVRLNDISIYFERGTDALFKWCQENPVIDIKGKKLPKEVIDNLMYINELLLVVLAPDIEQY